MIDLGAQVKAALDRACPRVYLAYPTAWTALPVVSFFELDNSEHDHADDDELTSSISYTVDVWAKTPEETHQIGALVNTAMRGMGFTRDGANDLYEPETRLHHRTMRFSIIAINEEE